MSQNKDLRVRRTLANIREAFLALVIEQGFENVTIQDIADRAMINRVTFYRHYTDKYDLAEKLSSTLLRSTVGTEGDVMAQLVRLFKHVEEYAPFYAAAAGPHGIPQFGERVRDEVEEGLYELFRQMGVDEDQTRMPLSLITRYAATAQAGFIQWWVENGMPFSAETAAQHLVSLHQNGVLWAAQGNVST